MPQDAAFGVAPGIDAIVRGPELPDREFSGKVTRIADAAMRSRTHVFVGPGYVVTPRVLRGARQTRGAEDAFRGREFCQPNLRCLKAGIV